MLVTTNQQGFNSIQYNHWDLLPGKVSGSWWILEMPWFSRRLLLKLMLPQPIVSTEHEDFTEISMGFRGRFSQFGSPGVYLERCAHARGAEKMGAGFRWVMGLPPKSSSHYTILVLKPKVTWGSPILRNFQVNLGVILNHWDLAFETEKQEGRNTWIYWSRVDIVLVFGRWHEFIQTLPRTYMPQRMCTYNTCKV